MTMIAFVGSDGAGKSTIVEAVRQDIARHSSVSLVDKWDILDESRFPEYRFLNTDLKTLRTCVAEMRDVNRSLFLFWALHGTLVPSRMAESDVVLLDGYWAKHAAVEIAYSAPAALIHAMIEIMPVPDLTILLDVDPQVAYARRAETGAGGWIPYECGQQPCSLTSFVAHQGQIRTTMLAWAAQRGWRVIDANRAGDVVLEEVGNIVRAHLGQAPR